MFAQLHQQFTAPQFVQLQSFTTRDTAASTAVSYVLRESEWCEYQLADDRDERVNK